MLVVVPAPAVDKLHSWLSLSLLDDPAVTCLSLCSRLYEPSDLLRGSATHGSTFVFLFFPAALLSPFDRAPAALSQAMESNGTRLKRIYKSSKTVSGETARASHTTICFAHISSTSMGSNHGTILKTPKNSFILQRAANNSSQDSPKQMSHGTIRES